MRKFVRNYNSTYILYVENLNLLFQSNTYRNNIVNHTFIFTNDNTIWIFGLMSQLYYFRGNQFRQIL